MSPLTLLGSKHDHMGALQLSTHKGCMESCRLLTIFMNALLKRGLCLDLKYEIDMTAHTGKYYLVPPLILFNQVWVSE